jgi:general stress protein 26
MAEDRFTHEDVTGYTLDDSTEEELLASQDECVFTWTNREGWPVGVVMSFVFRDGRFWLTASGQRARVPAVRRDPRVCVTVSSRGSGLSGNRAVTYKGTCVVHDDAETKAWFYPALVKRIQADRDQAYQDYYVDVLDSPRRVVLEVIPTKRIGFDGTKMRQATMSAFEAETSGS